MASGTALAHPKWCSTRPSDSQHSADATAFRSEWGSVWYGSEGTQGQLAIAPPILEEESEPHTSGGMGSQ